MEGVPLDTDGRRRRQHHPRRRRRRRRRRSRRRCRGLRPEIFLVQRRSLRTTGRRNTLSFSFLSLSSPHPFIQAGSRNERGGENLLLGQGSHKHGFFSFPPLCGLVTDCVVGGAGPFVRRLLKRCFLYVHNDQVSEEALLFLPIPLLGLGG